METYDECPENHKDTHRHHSHQGIPGLMGDGEAMRKKIFFSRLEVQKCEAVHIPYVPTVTILFCPLDD